jgi:hypothetical protein
MNLDETIYCRFTLKVIHRIQFGFVFIEHNPYFAGSSNRTLSIFSKTAYRTKYSYVIKNVDVIDIYNIYLNIILCVEYLKIYKENNFTIRNKSVAS